MIWGLLSLSAFFILSVKRPAWGLGLVLGLLPLYLFRFPILNIPTTALELLVGIFLVAVALTHFNKQSLQKITGLGKINYVVAAFLAAAIISTLISPEKTRALGQLKAFFIEPVLIFYAAVLILKNREQVNTVLKSLFISAFLISAFGIFQYFTHLFLPLRFWGYGLEVKRITSVFEYPNALALYLAPITVLFLTLWLKGLELFKKHWMIIGLGLMAVNIVLTYSRGAWLGIAVAVMVLLARQTGVSLKKWGITAAICLLILSPILFSRFKSTFSDRASTERLQLYQVAQEKILQQPLLGNGLYGFRTTLENSDYPGEILNYPHNILLNFWLETGLLGLLAFACLIYLGLRQYRLHPTTLKFAAGLFLLTLVIHGLVDAPYFKNDLSILFWFTLSLFYIEE